MSKVTGLRSIFRKNSVCGANIGFHTLTCGRSLGRWRCLEIRATDLVVMQGHVISQLYMDEVLRSVVLPFCTKTSDRTRPRMTMPEHHDIFLYSQMCGQWIHPEIHPSHDRTTIEIFWSIEFRVYRLG